MYSVLVFFALNFREKCPKKFKLQIKLLYSLVPFIMNAFSNDFFIILSKYELKKHIVHTKWQIMKCKITVVMNMLISYCLRRQNTQPLAYGLQFERGGGR